MGLGAKFTGMADRFSQSGKLGKEVAGRVNSYWAKSAYKPKLHKVVPASGDNLFTGLRLKKGVSALAMVGIGLAVAIKTGNSIANKGRNDITPAPTVPMPSLEYDNGMQARKDLGASGDIVFGLHRMK